MARQVYGTLGVETDAEADASEASQAGEVPSIVPYHPDTILYDDNGQPVAVDTGTQFVPLENTGEAVPGAGEDDASLVARLSMSDPADTAPIPADLPDEQEVRSEYGPDAFIVHDVFGNPVAVYTGSGYAPFGLITHQLFYDADGVPVAVDTGETMVRVEDLADIADEEVS